MNILGVIPARAGSKGIKDKNIYPCAGKPLIDWTVDSVCNSIGLIDFIISTNIYFIKEIYKPKIYIRPSELCEDSVSTISVIQDILSKMPREIDAICLLQPTSPLRIAEDINNAIKIFEESGRNSLYSGYYIGIKHKNKVYDKHTSEKHFQRNGAIFIAKRELIEQGVLWDNSVIEYEMPLSRSIDIDNLDDMYIAEALLEKRLREVKNP